MFVAKHDYHAFQPLLSLLLENGGRAQGVVEWPGAAITHERPGRSTGTGDSD